MLKRYGSRVVVKDVSLAVDAGEVVGLLGPNGAGKTTCFYMIVGLVPWTAARSRSTAVDCHLPIHRRARLGLSYLPQEASVFRKLTVEENIRAVLELQRRHAQQAAAPRGDRRRARGTARRAADRALAHQPRDVACPAANGGAWRSRAHWLTAALHPARRAVRRRRSDRGHRDPAHRALPQGARHRRPDHRPQRARDAGHLRSRLHHQRRRSPRLRPPGRDHRQRERPPVYLGEHFRM